MEVAENLQGLPPALFLRNRQADGEGCTLVRSRAGCLNGPTMCCDDRLAERQPNADSAEATGGRAIHLVEAIEDMRQLVAGDANSLVGDSNHRLAVLRPGPHQDLPAFRAKLDGVIEQVANDQFQVARAGQNRKRRFRHLNA